MGITAETDGKEGNNGGDIFHKVDRYRIIRRHVTLEHTTTEHAFIDIDTNTSIGIDTNVSAHTEPPVRALDRGGAATASRTHARHSSSAPRRPPLPRTDASAKCNGPGMSSPTVPSDARRGDFVEHPYVVVAVDKSQTTRQLAQDIVKAMGTDKCRACTQEEWATRPREPGKRVQVHAIGFVDFKDTGAAELSRQATDEPRETRPWDRAINITLDNIDDCGAGGFTVVSEDVEMAERMATDQIVRDEDGEAGTVCFRSHEVPLGMTAAQGAVHIMTSQHRPLPSVPRSPWVLPAASTEIFRGKDAASRRAIRHGASSCKHAPDTQATLINPKAVERWMVRGEGHYDCSLSAEIAKGMTLGPRDVGPVALSSNAASAYEYSDAVQDWFDKEVREGGLIGPFLSEEHAAEVLGVPSINCGSLAVIAQPRHDGTIKHRIVDNLSAKRRAPDGKALPSTNEACRSGAQPKARMPTHRMIIAMFERLTCNGRRPVHFGRLDLERAFRQLGLLGAERHLMCVHYDRWGKLRRSGTAYWLPDGHGESGRLFFANAATSMGHRLASFAFQRLSCALTYAAFVLDMNVVAYSDDLIYWALSLEGALACQDNLLRILGDMGIKHNAKKLLEDGQPATAGEILGVHYDSVAMTASMPSKTVTDVCRHIQSALDCKKYSLNLLRSLYGKLRWVGGCIEWSSLYLSHTRVFARKAEHLHRHGKIRLSAPCLVIPEGAREEMRWWRESLGKSNGVSIMARAPTVYEARELTTYTDASSRDGAGGWTRGKYLVHRWTERERQALARLATWAAQRDAARIDTGLINLLEMMAFLICFEAFTRDVRNAMIPCKVDNMTTVYWLNNRDARHPMAVALLREVHALCLERTLRIDVQHISTELNLGADHLSHGRIAEFLTYAHSHRTSPARIQAAESQLRRWLTLLETSAETATAMLPDPRKPRL